MIISRGLRMKVSDKDLKANYKSRIDRVFKFIDENIASNLSLNVVSEIAFYAPFHFLRVFKYITGETLKGYVTRKRIEKSAAVLLHNNVRITELAHQFGFSDNASYSKTFKKHYGVSPTEFKNQNPYRHSKIRQLKSKNGQDYPEYEEYICIINNLKKWIEMRAKIEIKELPKMDLAYVTSIGPQNLQMAYRKLIQWGTPKGLITDQSKMITVYHDSFKVTEANSVRMSASILLSKPVVAEGEIGLATIEAGQYIVGSFEIALNEFEKSWAGLFLWMNENGYKKADREPFEIYHNNFNEHPKRKAIVDFCIPIK